MTKKKNNNGNSKKLTTQQSVDQAVKSICDIMRRGNCAGALQYVPELTWILFLRILDEQEALEKERAEAVGIRFQPSLKSPYRWRDWAAPYDESIQIQVNGQRKPQGWKRKEQNEGPTNSFFAFVNEELLHYLKYLEKQPDANAKQKVISEVLSGVEKVRIDTEKNFQDVLDKVHEISSENVDPTHVFTLSQVYEGLLLKMGEKGNDGGQFFTPRQVIKAMVQVIEPKIGQAIYDPGCGTGGFLAQSFEYMREQVKSGTDLEALKHNTFWGREKENLIYPIALANLVLHGIDKPNIWHGNTLTGQESYGGLFEGAPPQFDVILTNPPFGGKEGKEAQTNFDYKTSATQVLFLQHVIRCLKDGGRCGIVLDEGVLFRTNEEAFVKTKRKLLDDCNLWCIVSLPGGVFTAAGAGVKTNLLFFTKGRPTKKIWYYDLTDIKVGKKTPLLLKHFEDFFKRLPKFEDSPLSWSVDIVERRKTAAAEVQPFKDEAAKNKQQAAAWNQRLKELKKAKKKDKAAIEKAEEGVKQFAKAAKEAEKKAADIENAVYDLKAVNPNKKPVVDTRTPEELLDIIEQKGKEISKALSMLRNSNR
jgi:type I restriction enzyme M protein